MSAGDRSVCRRAASVSLVVSGFGFTEGPVWQSETQSLIFSDIRGNAMHRLGPSGSVEVYRQPSNFANGSARDNQGRLVTCEHGTSRVVVEEAPGRLAVLASHWRGRALNSPNDVVVDSSDRIWFTDPIYGRMADYGIEREQELDFQGVYRLDPDGTLNLVADDFVQPNGLCLSLDESSLFVSDTRRFHIRRFAVGRGGRTTGGEVFTEVRGTEAGCPDGLKFDSLGRLFSCGPGGIHVFAPDGALIQVLSFPEEVTNFAWGGKGLRTLFVTAQSSVYSLPLSHPGRGVGALPAPGAQA